MNVHRVVTIILLGVFMGFLFACSDNTNPASPDNLPIATTANDSTDSGQNNTDYPTPVTPDDEVTATPTKEVEATSTIEITATPTETVVWDPFG